MKTIFTLLISALCLTSIGQTFDVLLYRDTANPDGLPENWPARVEVSAGRPAPWFRATREQLEAYKATHQAAYANWSAQKEAERRAAEDAKAATRDQLIVGAIARVESDLPKLTTAIATWDGMTTAQRLNVVKELLELIKVMAQIQRAQLKEELN